MSVQSGMISEPPVNVNDSDHSAVTWLSIFFYSLGAGARVARFRRGKRKQQPRRELRPADARVLPGGDSAQWWHGNGRVLPKGSFCGTE